ncbi:MAG: hypothetical protein ACTSRG_27285 [Candidatus Helarchaeota archaeon]
MKATAIKTDYGNYIIMFTDKNAKIRKIITQDAQLYDAVQAFFEQGLKSCEGCWFENRKELEEYLENTY